MISVIVPVYNNMTDLERCVDSLLAQTHRDLEVLLVDDGSTDETGSLCDKLQKKDDRIRVFHKANGGTSSARNLGIEMAEGSCFSFVDSDDTIEEDMLEKLYLAMEKGDCGIVQIGRDEQDETGRRLPGICEVPKEETRYEAEEFLKELLLHRGDCSFCTKLVKRELFEQLRFPEGELNEDFWLLVQMLAKGEGVYSLPYVGYHVFYRQESNTRKKDGRMFSRVFSDNVVNADRVHRIVTEHFPALTEISVRFGLVQRLDYLLHIPIPEMKREREDYARITDYLRKHRSEICKNAYLSGKNKSYLLILSFAPRTVRQLHALTMKVRGV